jgi:hypothetical protein
MKPADFWERHAFKLIGIALIALVAIFAVRIAYAAGPTATLTWTHPVAFTDSSALALSEIKETVITWRRPNSTVIVGSVRVPAPATTRVVSGLACGSFNFTAQAVVKTNDIQSDESPTVLYTTGVQCAPNPPTGLAAS